MTFNPGAILLFVGGVVAILVGLRGTNKTALAAIVGPGTATTKATGSSSATLVSTATAPLNPASFFDAGVLGAAPTAPSATAAGTLV